MFTPCITHDQYQQFLRKQIPVLWKKNPKRLKSFEKSLSKMWLMNLDPAIPLLAKYSSPIGRPIEHDPVSMLRSLILMRDQKVFSAPLWVEKLRSDDILAVLSGFKPGNTPGVGTFYDFLDRFWLEDKEIQLNRKKQLRSPVRKPRKKPKSGEKQPPKHPDVVNKLCKRAMKKRDPFPFRAERLIQEVFARCFVDRSVELGLIPDPLSLVLSGDGSSLRTGSSPYGVKVCNCREKGVFNCNCKRRFSDPQASWGWDSYRNEYFYGYSIFSLTAAGSPNDLPVYVRLASAARHDSVMSVVALAEFRQLYPHFGVGKFLGDSALDAYAIYELCEHWQIEPFIALNSKNEGHYRFPPPVMVNDYGIPLCPKGFPMVFWGYEKDRNRLKWRCPLAAGSRKAKDQIKCDSPCSPSAYGRTVYTKPRDDLRLFTKTPRNSKAWKDVFKRRTSSERSFDRMKVDYELERCRVRSCKAWYWQAHFTAMNQHLDAWVKQAVSQGFDIWVEVLGSFADAA